VKQIVARLKPYLRWVILGTIVFFLATTLRQHWQEVAAIRIDHKGWSYLAIALLLTLVAHIWSGWVWGWILSLLEQPVAGTWSIRVYLKTNLAKYLPGNVWHFYGRIWAAKAVGMSLGAATLSVLLEPLLMAAGALILSLITTNQQHWGIQLISLTGVLVGVHPRILNPMVQLLGRFKKPKALTLEDNDTPLLFKVSHYPTLPLLGELGFLGLRGGGFVFVVLALSMVSWEQIPLLLGAFSFSWLLGLIVPLAPGGIGVFEVTAIALLDQFFSVGLLLSAVALYRLISILAEIIGAGIAWLYDRRI
jgi:uncharacterized membrane protein YbhN (UPF0104 family)